ncbi:hypothetical protein BS78_09G004300 [Paspalum vaginatum]|nr:hypothetical protein BS78_09G004300 [Paspalum vaginatum]
MTTRSPLTISDHLHMQFCLQIQILSDSCHLADSGGGQDHQGADLGHGRAGAVPSHHQRLLPRRPRRRPRLRRQQAHHLREHHPVAQGAARPRRLQHPDHARRRQDRPEAPPGRAHRRRAEIC